MAIAGDKDVVFGEELSASHASLVRDLQQRFPEIPANVISSSLNKNGGNLSRCIDDLELASPSFMYGEFVGHDTPTHSGVTMHNAEPGTNHCAMAYSSHLHTPERGRHAHSRDYNHPGCALQDLEDPDRTPQPSYTSWASLETGVPDSETLTEMRQYPANAEELRHVSSCTVAMQKPPERTISVPASHIGGSYVSPLPSGLRQGEGDAFQRQSSSPYGRTSNGVEEILDPQDFPFEPRPAWQDDAVSRQHFLELRGTDEAGTGHGGGRQTATHTHIKPAEMQTTMQLASSHHLDPPKPSRPVAPPTKGNPSRSPPVASYTRATGRVLLNPNPQAIPTNEPSRASQGEGRGQMHETSLDLHVGGTGFSGTDRIPPKGGSRQRAKNTLIPSLPMRSVSKEKHEKEDQAYTEALLMHQKARFERLCKELEEERKTLAEMREQTASMERDMADKRNHRPPFPTPEAIGKLREQKRQLQIDIECMTREIELHKSQGLMDLSQANNFYGNIGSTGAPGPVPPKPTNSIPETPVAPPPSYREVMEGQMWSCSACTLLNHPALDKCECCEMPRDK